MTYTLRQNLILSRITARGAVTEYTDPDDFFKVVKTDDTGQISNSLLKDSLLYHLTGNIHITDWEAVPSVGLERVAYGSGVFKSLSAAQQATFRHRIFIQADDITLNDEMTVRYKFTQVDAGCYFEITFRDNVNPDQTIQVTAIDTDWHEEVFPLTANTVNSGDVLEVLIEFFGDNSHELMVDYVNFNLESL